MRVESVAEFSRSRMAFRSGGNLETDAHAKRAEGKLALSFWAAMRNVGAEKKRDKNKMTQVRSGLICEAWAENEGRRREKRKLVAASLGGGRGGDGDG